MTSRDRLGVAVVGAGYWGPNLIRNFRAGDDWDLVAVCDLDTDRAHRVLGSVQRGPRHRRSRRDPGS